MSMKVGTVGGKQKDLLKNNLINQAGIFGIDSCDADADHTSLDMKGMKEELLEGFQNGLPANMYLPHDHATIKCYNERDGWNGFLKITKNSGFSRIHRIMQRDITVAGKAVARYVLCLTDCRKDSDGSSKDYELYCGVLSRAGDDVEVEMDITEKLHASRRGLGSTNNQVGKLFVASMDFLPGYLGGNAVALFTDGGGQYPLKLTGKTNGTGTYRN